MPVFDITFDYKTDAPPGKDPDKYSKQLKADQQLLWTKELSPGVLFEPREPADAKTRRTSYLLFEDVDGARFRYGSDAITSSYTTWVRPKSLVEARTGLDEEQRRRFLNPPYTVGSTMIWPVRSADRPAMNPARGMRLSIADRMDLTLECIRRHYAGAPGSALEDVIQAYADFFALFVTFRQFVEFFHLQDLVNEDCTAVKFFLPFNDFNRAGTPTTTDEYVTYREAVLDFIARRGNRMADWVEENHPEVEVRR